MATRSQKVKLGVFLTIAAVLFVVTLATFAGLRMFDSKDRYFILFEESVSGLELGSPVKLRGVRVGQVSRVQLNPENVEEVKVTVLLDEGTPVKTDTQAVLQMQGITGLKFVELLDGTRKAAALKPEGYISAGKSLASKISGRAESLGEKADRVLDNLLVLTGEDNQKAIASTLTHVESMVKSIDEMTINLNEIIKQISEILEQNREPLHGVFENVDVTTRRVATLVSDADRLILDLRRVVEGVRLKETIDGINETNGMVQQAFGSVDVSSTIDNVTVTLAGMQVLLEQLTRMMGQNQDQLRATMYNLRLATQSIRAFSRSVEEKPSGLIFDERPKERKLP